MDLAYAYIPIDRQLALSRREELPEHTHGAALFADLSGFTPLTEALVRALGSQRGAEELTRQLNLVYDALIHQVQNYRGVVIGFSGDAITCWFDGDDGHRAITCALAMQQEMRQFAAVPIPNGGTVALALKAAVVTGSVRRFAVGDSRVQVIDVLAGTTLDRLAEGEHQAEKGDVVVDVATAEQLGSVLRVREWRSEEHGRFGVVASLDADVPMQPWETVEPGTLPEEVVKPWILPPVYARLQSGQGTFLAELRPAVALFLRFGGIDFENDPLAGHKLDDYVCWVQNIVSRYEGVLVQLTIGDKGSYLYAAFGAPIAHNDDAVRAVRAALELQAIPPDLAFITPPQIGISRGRMRVGPYGSTVRRTYGVLGDEVNVAARLMQAASPGQILVTEPLAGAAGRAFAFEAMPPLRVKGKSEPLRVLTIATENITQLRARDTAAALPLVGRTTEQVTIAARIEQAAQGHGQIIAISAEAGMGKTRLAEEALRRARFRGFAQYKGESQSFGANTPYLPWQTIWHEWFGLALNAPQEDCIWQLEQELARINPLFRLRAPLLGPALNLNLPDNDLTSSLDAKQRKQLLEGLLVDIVRAKTADAPTVFWLEDLHWMDTLSQDLLTALARETADRPVLFVLTYRPRESERLNESELTRLPQFTELPLHDFTSEEAARLIALKLAQLGSGEATPPASVVERLTARAGGNPFYIEELLNYMRDRGLDPRNATQLEQLDLPDSLHSLILSRIDQLSESQKVTLKVASIIGRQFRDRWLWGVYSELGTANKVYQDLETLNRVDLTPLDQPEPDPSHIFRHAMTHQVTYESQPYAARAQLHGNLGEFLEETYADELDQYIDLLALHYDRSENLNKKREYLLKAGEQAQAVYANDAAIDYYRRALPLIPERERVPVMLKLGQVYEVTGRWDDATTLYEEGLKLAIAVADERAQGLCETALGSLTRRRGNYAQARNWLAVAQYRFEELNDIAGLGQVLHEMGTLSAQQGAYPEAREFYQASLRLRRELSETRTIASLLSNLGILARFQNDYDGANALYQESLDLRRQIGDRFGISVSLNNLGMLKRYQEDYAEARRLLEASLTTLREIGDRMYLANTLTSLAEVELDQGDAASAQERLEESLAINRALGEKRAIAYLLENFARAEALEGHANRAMQLAGAASALRETIAAPLSAAEQTKLEQQLQSAQESLGAERAQQEWQRGREMSLDAAIEFAMAG